MKESALTVALALLVLLEAAALWRTVRAPTMADRILAGTLAGNILTFILLAAGVLGGSELYLDAVLAAVLLSFSSTIVVAKWVTEKRLL